MEVQMEEWQRFIPGVRMYKGKMTYFYNGDILYDEENHEFLVDDAKERMKWEVVMVLPGVEIIPMHTFQYCMNVETVIMSDSIKRIERSAFNLCNSLDLECIGAWAFQHCESLTSIFIPESCREVGHQAFNGCLQLIILSFVPRHTELRASVIDRTALSKASPFETDPYGHYKHEISNDINEWVQNLNQTEEFALHRECASIEPSEDNIYEIIKQKGLPSIRVKNQIGVTALEYLEKNPYTVITEQKLIKRLVLDLMGEFIP